MKILSIISFMFILNISYAESIEEYYIRKTNEKFLLIEDYQVNMNVKLEIPAFRMPKKKYKVFYKNPDMIKVKARGFGILPKTGLFTSPLDNFDNLKNIRILNDNKSLDANSIILIGDLIVDSLKLEMPNEYTKITFDPIVEVEVDTLNWVIKNVTTRLDTLKLFNISNYYDLYDDKYYMPNKSIVKYYVKDKKIFNWLNKDVSNIIGKDGQGLENNSIVEGTITVDYYKYIINKGIEDKVFD